MKEYRVIHPQLPPEIFTDYNAAQMRFESLRDMAYRKSDPTYTDWITGGMRIEEREVGPWELTHRGAA